MPAHATRTGAARRHLWWKMREAGARPWWAGRGEPGPWAEGAGPPSPGLPPPPAPAAPPRVPHPAGPWQSHWPHRGIPTNAKELYMARLGWCPLPAAEVPTGEPGTGVPNGELERGWSVHPVCEL